MRKGGAEARSRKPKDSAPLSPVEVVAGRLEHYARRGTFRSFSRGAVRRGGATFKMRWHRDRVFELVVDTRGKTLRFPLVLPQVPPRSKMDRELRAFVRAGQSAARPEHRRIDAARAAAQVYNRGGQVSIGLKLRDDDYDYATLKLVHLVHEIFLIFLYDGRYYDYMIEVFGLDADRE